MKSLFKYVWNYHYSMIYSIFFSLFTNFSKSCLSDSVKVSYPDLTDE